MATKETAHLGIKVSTAGVKKAQAGIRRISAIATKAKQSIFSLQGAMVGLGGGMVLKSALNYASSIENLRVQLVFLTGDTKKAAKAFEALTKFAKKAPFTLKEIQKASPALQIVANDTEELNELLEMTGDIATVTGADFEVVAQNLLRAMEGGIAASELFREKGVKNMLGFLDGVQYTAYETKKRFFDAFRDGTTTIKGATAEMAKTFTGQVSMMGDAWDNLQLSFMKEGVFGSTKTQVKELTAWLKSPSVQKGAKDLGKSVTSVAKGIKEAVVHYNGLPEHIKTAGIVFAVFGGKVGKVALIAMIGYAEELKAILQEVGLMDYTPTQLTDQMAYLDGQIANTQKAIDKLDWNWVQKIVFSGSLADPSQFMEDLQARKADLQDKINEHPLALNGVFLPPTKKEDNTPSDPIYTPEPTAIETSKKLIDKLKGSVIAYAESIKDVGVEVTDVMQLTRSYEKELEKINGSFKKGDENNKDKIKLLDELTTAYENAQNRLKDFKINDYVKSMADSMEGTITSAIMNMSKGIGDFGDLVKSVMATVMSEIIKINIARPMAQGLSSMLFGKEGLFPAGQVDLNTIARSDTSFAGGGFTGSGGRSGGVDGKGGFNAILHPNETVVDHTKGQSQGQTVIVNYSPQVNALDPRTAQMVIAENAQTIVGVVRQAFNRNGQQVAI